MTIGVCFPPDETSFINTMFAKLFVWLHIPSFQQFITEFIWDSAFLYLLYIFFLMSIINLIYRDFFPPSIALLGVDSYSLSCPSSNSPIFRISNEFYGLVRIIINCHNLFLCALNLAVVGKQVVCSQPHSQFLFLSCSHCSLRSSSFDSIERVDDHGKWLPLVVILSFGSFHSRFS